MSLTHKWDAKCADSVKENEDIIDAYEDKIGSYLIKLSGRDLTQEDSHEVSVLLHTISDFERIGDHACNIYESAQEIHDKQRFYLAEAGRTGRAGIGDPGYPGPHTERF